MGFLSVFLSALKGLTEAIIKKEVPLLLFYEPSFESCGSMKTQAPLNYGKHG